MESVEGQSAEDTTADAEENADDMLLVLAGADEQRSLDSSSAKEDSQQFVVRVLGDQSALVAYESKSIHFYAMVKSIHEGTLLTLPVLASFVTIVVQLTLLNAFVFAYYLGPAGTNGAIGDDLEALLDKELPGGLSEKAGVLCAYLVAPVVMLAKIERNKELEQMPAFLVTARTLLSGQSGTVSALIHGYWSLVFVLRAYWVLPYMAFSNAVIVVETKSVRHILVMVFAVTFLLDLDDMAFQAFYANDSPDDGEAAVWTKRFTTVRIGKRTMAICRALSRRTKVAVVCFQAVLMLIVKVHPFLVLLWTLPLLGAWMMLMQRREIPNADARVVGTEALVLATACVWLWSLRCTMTPVCGADSRYYMGQSFLDTKYAQPFLDAFGSSNA